MSKPFESYSILSLIGKNQGRCGYCDKENTSYTYGVWAHTMTCQDYQRLIDRGWRRSGHYLYKPDIQKSCCPQYTIRLNAVEFKATKSQRKVTNKINRYTNDSQSPKENTNTKNVKQNVQKTHKSKNIATDAMDMVDCVDTGKRLEIVLEYASFTKEKFDLYCKYQVQIHKDTMEELSEEAFQRFLVESPLESEASDLSIDYGSFHQKYILDGKLIAVAVLDILPKCISSVYFFYDPDYSSLALGKYSALQEIDLTRKLHSVSDDLKWYYMGFYIHSCPKMNYKGQYKPSDLLDPITYDWYPFTQCQEQLEKTRYAVFSGPIPPPSDTPSGWLDPESIKEDHLKSVRMLAARGQLVPVTAHARWSKSANLRQSVREYVAAVGHTMAECLILYQN